MSFSNNKIALHFDRAAVSYDAFASLQRQMSDTILRWLLHEMDAASIDSNQPLVGGRAIPNRPSHTRIADLGCGTGYLLRQLQQYDAVELFGFDIAAKMLEVAQQTLSPSASRPVCLVQSDLQSLPVEDGLFDVVISNAAIQWCDTAHAVSEIARVVRPGGQVFLSTFGPRTLGEIKTVFSRHDRDSVHEFDSANAIGMLFSKAKLDVIKIETQRQVQVFHQVQTMFDAIRKLGATYAGKASQPPISKSTYRSIWSSFQSNLDRDGVLPLTFETIFIQARKPRTAQSDHDHL